MLDLRAAAVAADEESHSEINVSFVWRELTTGRATVLDSFCEGARCYLVVRENTRPVSPPGLSARSVAVLCHALVSPLQKNAAYALGITPSAVAFAARRCLRAMGLECTVSTTPALVIAAALDHNDGRRRVITRTAPLSHQGETCRVFSIPRPAPPALAALSEAEQEIVRLVVERRSNREIARLRSTSTHTVANQLSRILQKLGVDGRAGVVQRLMLAP